MNKDILNINKGFITKNRSEIYSSLLSFLKNNSKRIRFQKHPLGFKYFKLGKISEIEEFRLHYWSGTDENQDDELQIHDHSFNFDSFIVCGIIKNIKFNVTNNENSDGYIYKVNFQNENSNLFFDSKNKLIDIESYEIIKSGEFYSMKNYEFHESKNLKKNSITLLKIIKTENKVAQVFSPKEIINFKKFERKFVPDIENSKLIEKLIKKVNKVSANYSEKLHVK